MKTFKKLILSVIFLFTMGALSAQTPPPPNGTGGAPGGGNTPVGGGAPVGGGLFLLLAIGAAYGGKKVYNMRKEKTKEKDLYI
nr:hypothetical protein [Bacteroidota bacterium]